MKSPLSLSLITLLICILATTESSSCEKCQSCEYEPLLLPETSDFSLPDEHSSTIVDGCLNTFIRCFRSAQTICISISLKGVTDNGTIVIGSSDTAQGFGTLTCDGSGEYVYEGQKINNIYCSFIDCL